VEKFLDEARTCGVDGVIVPDLLPEESDKWRKLSLNYGISNIFLVAPTTPDERIRYLDSVSSDFTYCVSVTGVTGARTGFGDLHAFETFLRRVKKNTTKPFVVGFGISTREHVSTIFRHADGVVIGSALLQKIEEEKSIEAVVRKAGEFLSSLVS
jgi:tryptophan synthase alpha chain